MNLSFQQYFIQYLICNEENILNIIPTKESASLFHGLISLSVSSDYLGRSSYFLVG